MSPKEKYNKFLWGQQKKRGFDQERKTQYPTIGATSSVSYLPVTPHFIRIFESIRNLDVSQSVHTKQNLYVKNRCRNARKNESRRKCN